MTNFGGDLEEVLTPCRVENAVNHLMGIGMNGVDTLASDPELLYRELRALLEQHATLKDRGRLSTLIYGVLVGIQIERERALR